MAQYGGEEYRKEEQYGGEEYRKEEGRYGDGYDRNPLHPTATGHHEIGGMGSNMYSATAGQDIGGDQTTVGMGGGQGYEEGKHDGAGGMLRRSGSGGSSSSEDDGEGGRRKKKGVMERMRGGDHGGDERKTSATVGGGGYGYEYEGEEGHEKKGLMEKIKEKLPGGHDQ